MPEQVKYTLLEVSPESVEFSDANPRGETPDEIAEDDTFEQLKDSIYKYGVLVPIVVHELPESPSGKRYRLVDGERRLRAALATGAETIPAHIAPSERPLDEMAQAVHIHMLRKHWRPVAQARAVKRIMKLARESEPAQSEADLLRELQALTGCTDTRLKALRRASKYPEKVLNEVDDGGIAFSHLVQFEESFVEQVEEHYPRLVKDVGKRRIREILVTKARKGVLSGTRALMDNIVPVIGRAASQKEKQFVEGVLGEFISEEDMPAEEVKRRFDARFPRDERDLLKLCDDVLAAARDLSDMLQTLNMSEVLGLTDKRKQLEKSLRSLCTTINGKLRTLSRRR
jgi:ParB/RepB/Spo0J family partition protein